MARRGCGEALVPRAERLCPAPRLGHPAAAWQAAHKHPCRGGRGGPRKQLLPFSRRVDTRRESAGCPAPLCPCPQLMEIEVGKGVFF